MSHRSIRYRILEGVLGPQLRLEQAWDDSLLELIDQHRIKELLLSDIWKWRHDGSLDFLEKLKDKEILGLSLVDETIEDIAAIEGLSSLKFLFLLTNRPTKIDLSRLQQLEAITLEGKISANGLFERESLKILTLKGFKGKDISSFSKLQKLIFLKIANSPLDDIAGLKGLGMLKFLNLAYLTKLQTLQGLENLFSLEELCIDTCKKIKSLRPLSNLKKLRILELDNCGEIDTLNYLVGLESLTTLRLTRGTEVIDGRIKAITSLPRLKVATISPRKHYDLREVQIAKEELKGDLAKTDPQELLRQMHKARNEWGYRSN